MNNAADGCLFEVLREASASPHYRAKESLLGLENITTKHTPYAHKQAVDYLEIVHMEIHHYTKASTLPLILASKKLRFTRADALDDTAEIPFTSAHLDARKFFISSWTAVSNEQSGQWARYGDHDAGVRLTFRSTPFICNTLDFELSRDRAPGEDGGRIGVMLDKIVTPFTKETMFGNGYILYPYCDDMSENFGGHVTYVDDPVSYAKQFLKASAEVTEITGGNSLARVKSRNWEDQMEYRFVLMALSGPRLDYASAPATYESSLLDHMEENSRAGSVFSASDVSVIDLPIDPNALRSLEVTLGAKITHEDRERVLHSLKVFAPEARIKNSVMQLR